MEKLLSTDKANNSLSFFYCYVLVPNLGKCKFWITQNIPRETIMRVYFHTLVN